MEERYSEVTTGYELADSYVGQIVKVFMSNGTVLTGKLVRREGKYFLLHDKRQRRPAMINLDDISSIV